MYWALRSATCLESDKRFIFWFFQRFKWLFIISFTGKFNDFVAVLWDGEFCFKIKDLILEIFAKICFLLDTYLEFLFSLWTENFARFSFIINKYSFFILRYTDSNVSWITEQDYFSLEKVKIVFCPLFITKHNFVINEIFISDDNLKPEQIITVKTKLFQIKCLFICSIKMLKKVCEQPLHLSLKILSYIYFMKITSIVTKACSYFAINTRPAYCITIKNFNLIPKLNGINLTCCEYSTCVTYCWGLSLK